MTDTEDTEDPWAFFSKPRPPLTSQEEAARRKALRWFWLKSRRTDWRDYYPYSSWTGARIGHFRRLFCVLFHASITTTRGGIGAATAATAVEALDHSARYDAGDAEKRPRPRSPDLVAAADRCRHSDLSAARVAGRGSAPPVLSGERDRRARVGSRRLRGRPHRRDDAGR
jgi:hypothetical protein